MIYSMQDLQNLESMEDEEIREEIALAKEKLEELNGYFTELEEESKNVFDLPNLSILFSNIKNIEGYIRRAENLLFTYDTNKMVLQAYDRRQIILHTKKKKFIKVHTTNIKTNL